jgi:uncharacterized protein
MQYRRFGRTELLMPVFSCGGMRYQQQWQDTTWDLINDDSQHNIEKIIDRALECGINHIETARDYGTSEMQLGKFLPKLPRDKMIVQTKVPPRENPGEFRKNFDTSFDYLKLDYVDLLGLHGINTPQLLEWAIRPGGCLDVAKSLQAEGKVRFIGFSTHAPTDVIIKAIETDRFDYVNLHWYYINQSNWPAIEAATRHDMGVFIISPSNKGGLLYQPSQKLIDLCAPLSPMVFNNLFCLSHPQVHTLSIGASQPQDFDAHLLTLPLLDYPDDLLPPIIERLEEEAINKLGEEWVKTWHIGLPTQENTPGNINIPAIIWLWNLTIAYDMVEYGKFRYNLLGNGGHWFPGKKADTLAQYDLKPCLAQSPHGDKIIEVLQECDRVLGGESVKRLSQQ